MLAGCGDGAVEPGAAEGSAAVAAAADADRADAARTYFEQMHRLDAAVSQWRGARSLDGARAAAEAAANLVVGTNGPGYGDRDGDGVVGGESGVGVLPGLDGEPPGLASLLPADNECVRRDVLGGSWSDPAGRWDEMLVAIDAWRPSANTMPSLASHPMRVVGWAMFTLATDDLDEAHEYGGHARLHVDVAVDALDC